MSRVCQRFSLVTNPRQSRNTNNGGIKYICEPFMNESNLFWSLIMKVHNSALGRVVYLVVMLATVLLMIADRYTLVSVVLLLLSCALYTGMFAHYARQVTHRD